MFSGWNYAELVIFILALVTPLLMCLIALADILKSRFEGGNKFIWIVIVILLPVAGALFYYFVGRKQKSGFRPFNS